MYVCTMGIFSNFFLLNCLTKFQLALQCSWRPLLKVLCTTPLTYYIRQAFIWTAILQMSNEEWTFVKCPSPDLIPAIRLWIFKRNPFKTSKLENPSFYNIEGEIDLRETWRYISLPIFSPKILTLSYDAKIEGNKIGRAESSLERKHQRCVDQ